jgi:hypothetical protein
MQAEVARYIHGRGNPVSNTDPSGHAVVPNCIWCDRTWLDYSNQTGLAERAIDAGATVVCLFVGCHVDRQQNWIVGPTQQEYVDSSVLNLIPVGMAAGPAAKATGSLAEGLNRTQVIQKLGETVQPYLSTIRQLAGEDALIGFRGSLAQGTVGNPRKPTFGQPVNLANFDIDAFIVSDELAELAMWGTDVPGVRQVQQAIEQDLRRMVEFDGLRSRGFGFRIFTQEEADELFSGVEIFFTGGAE